MLSIETNRLVLQSWKKEDAKALYEYAKNPNVGPKAGWKPHDSVEESKKIIKVIFIPNNVFKIRLKEENKIIGTIGLEKDKRRVDISSKEMGYALSEDYWNKGIMKEAAVAVLDYGFKTLGLDIVSATVSPKNIPSMKVIESLGFKYEGTERKAYRIFDGSIEDIRCYSLLKEEWEER